MDDNDPPGFVNEIQAITLDRENEEVTFKEIVRVIKDKFPKHTAFRKKALDDFFSTQGLTFKHAKDAFMNLINFQFNDLEIEQIVKAIKCKELNDKGYFGRTNQLAILLSDLIEEEHLKLLSEDKYEYYAQLLDDKILSQHTKKKYSLKGSDGVYEIVNNDEINKDKMNEDKINKDKMNEDELNLEDLPF